MNKKSIKSGISGLGQQQKAKQQGYERKLDLQQQKQQGFNNPVNPQKNLNPNPNKPVNLGGKLKGDQQKFHRTTNK